jgi:hypothetical protein
MTTKFINLFAGPGAGKSTSAAGLFYYLKSQSINSEIIVEVAKEKVWAEDFKSLGCQPYITGKQLYRQWRLNGKVKYAVTDSPLLLGLIYSGFGCDENWEKSVLHQFSLFNNVNVFLKRNSDAHPFQQEGRMQDEDECRLIDEKIKKLLNDNNIPFYEIEVSEDNSHIQQILKEFTEWKP